jgi:hypothetical protein
VLRTALVALLGAGCLVDTDGELSGGIGGTGGGGDGGGDAPLTSCGDPVVLDAPGRYAATIPGAPDAGAAARCGSAAEAAIFRIDLPLPAWVYLDTLDSPSGSVLSLRAETCDGEELLCSDAACGALAGQILAPLSEGSFFVRVQGPPGEAITLRFQASACGALPLQPGTTAGSVGDCAGGEAGSCGGGPTSFCAAGVAEEVWVLAGCGQDIQIDTCVGTLFDSVLTLRSGDCLGPEVACVNANSCGDGDDEVLAGTLSPGMYFLLVDSNSWWNASYNLGFE